MRAVSSCRAELRLGEAAAWLASRPPAEEVLVIGATYDAASELVRRVARTGFGWHRLTLGRLAAERSKLALADRDLAPAGQLALEALAARVLQRLRAEGRLGRLASVVDQPGTARGARAHPRRAAHGGRRERRRARGRARGLRRGARAQPRLADRAIVFATAAEQPIALPAVLVDVPIRAALERRLVAALAGDVLATIPAGDGRTLAALAPVTSLDAPDLAADALARAQRHLFGDAPAPAALDDSLVLMSAPGESRECLEIARRVLAEARAGVPFDRMAVLLRSPEVYRVHLEEAMGRAGVPVYFDAGARMPDPSGRAFLALLACATEDLSAHRFGEYLSLGEVPGEVPAPAAAYGDRWTPPDEELIALAAWDREPVPTNHDDAPSVRAPWRWERLVVDAAVIGSRDRWAKRLAGLAETLRKEPEPNARALADLAALRAYALPLIDDLAALPERATWGTWIDVLGALATRALRHPARVLAVLAALHPMAAVDDVSLAEVQIVLRRQLAELIVPPPKRRHGRLFVAAIEQARGHAFDVVFVPGLAERMFPQKVVEDPLLLDAARASLHPGELAVRADRLADERLALRLAIGAATRRAVVSYPRIDLDQGKPRVPSFYALELIEAAEGALPGFDELGRRAFNAGGARIGWPAPSERADAIDEAEHDLVLLDEAFRAGAPKGAASYLLGTNAHLARALRFRARRWTTNKWLPSDGLIAQSAAAKAALAAHAPDARSFSATALEQLAACPYRFALRTILRLQPRKAPAAIESIGPLERGSLVHEVQFELLGELRAVGQLPIEDLDRARANLDVVLDRVAARYRDDLCPAIDRVWADGIASIRADLREWLRRLAADPWIPRRFELAFGLTLHKDGRDPASVDAPVQLDGLQLRGSIDLVEEGPAGVLRATDHKTGKPRVDPGAIVAGGASLQPALYALALEKLFPGAAVGGGRLSYCTTRGNFSIVDVPLDVPARSAIGVLAATLAHHASEGFYPAAPIKGACEYCDFRPVCGPYEEQRAGGKAHPPLVQLRKLRELP